MLRMLQRLALPRCASGCEPAAAWQASPPHPPTLPPCCAELGGYAAAHKLKIDIQVRIVHEREVNKARYCPQNKTLIGAWAGTRYTQRGLVRDTCSAGSGESLAAEALALHWLS